MYKYLVFFLSVVYLQGCSTGSNTGNTEVLSFIEQYKNSLDPFGTADIKLEDCILSVEHETTGQYPPHPATKLLTIKRSRIDLRSFTGVIHSSREQNGLLHGFILPPETTSEMVEQARLFIETPGPTARDEAETLKLVGANGTVVEEQFLTSDQILNLSDSYIKETLQHGGAINNRLTHVQVGDSIGEKPVPHEDAPGFHDKVERVWANKALKTVASTISYLGTQAKRENALFGLAEVRYLIGLRAQNSKQMLDMVIAFDKYRKTHCS